MILERLEGESDEERSSKQAGHDTYNVGNEWRRNAQLLDGPPIDPLEPGLIVDIARLAGGHAHPFGRLALEQLCMEGEYLNLEWGRAIVNAGR